MSGDPRPTPDEALLWDPRRLARYTPLQRHFLTRLSHLDAPRRASETEVLLSDEDQRLLSLATYGAWRDCADEGLDDVASRLLGVEVAAA